LARLNLPVALTLCAPATQPLKQSDIGGCSASVTPRNLPLSENANICDIVDMPVQIYGG